MNTVKEVNELLRYNSGTTIDNAINDLYAGNFKNLWVDCNNIHISNFFPLYMCKNEDISVVTVHDAAKFCKRNLKLIETNQDYIENIENLSVFRVSIGQIQNAKNSSDITNILSFLTMTSEKAGEKLSSFTIPLDS